MLVERIGLPFKARIKTITSTMQFGFQQCGFGAIALAVWFSATIARAGELKTGETWCAYRASAVWLADVRAAVDAGDVADPAVRSADVPARTFSRNVGERGWRPVTASD